MLKRKENRSVLMRKVSGYRKHTFGIWNRTAVCMAAFCLLLTACGEEGIDAQSMETGGIEESVGESAASGGDVLEYVPESREEAQVGVQDKINAENSIQQEAPLLTFERLQELIQEPVPLLEHYAGYQDIGSDIHWDEENGLGCILYPVSDLVSGADIVLHIVYETEDNQIYQMYLSRRNDVFHCGLYFNDGGAPGYFSDVSSKMEQYREEVGELFYWIKQYEFPGNIYMRIRPWQFRTDMGAGDWKGQTYWWVGEEPEEEQDSDGEPPEWKAVFSIMQVPQEYLVFAGGKLQEVLPLYDQAVLTMEYEPLEGCGEQAVIWKISAKLNTQTVNEAAEDYWYVCLGREDSPWGYIAAMTCRHFSWEEAVEFAQRIQFHDAAWQ